MQALKTKVTIDSCPLCKQNIHFRFKERSISYCRSCNFYYLNPRPEQREIIDSYNTSETYNRWQNEQAIRSKLWRKRLDFILKFKKTGLLLDVGTGDGFFLKFASDFFQVNATEISEAGVKIAKNRGFNPFQGSILEMDHSEDLKYDVITLWHVLEHLPDPSAILKQIQYLLKEDGILVIAVPNEFIPLFKLKHGFENIKEGWAKSIRGMEIHLNYFTPGSLKKYIKRIGFKQVLFKVDDVHIYRSKKVLLFYLVNRLLNRLFRWHAGRAMVLIAKKRDIDG